MSDQIDNRDEKLDLMLEQIKTLFFEFGIKNLNMDDISHKLGISKKTLYRFVKSKEDLIARIFDYEEKKWAETMNMVSSQEVNAIEKLFKVSLLAYEEMKRFNPMLMFEMRKYYESLFNSYQTKRLAHISTSMRVNLEKGIREGLYRKEVNSDAVIAIYMNYLIEIHDSDLCKAIDLTFDELFSVMFENHIRAISTPDGVAYFEYRKKEVTESLNKNNN